MRQSSFLDWAGCHEDNWFCNNVVSMNESYVYVTHSYCPWWELGKMGVVELVAVKLVAVEQRSTPVWSGHYVHRSMYSVGVTGAAFIG